MRCGVERRDVELKKREVGVRERECGSGGVREKKSVGRSERESREE